MRSKKKKKNDTLYHVLFWVIVVVLFPVSISVWFYRNNPLNLTEQARKLYIGLFWGVLALIILLCIGIPVSKKNRTERAASIEASMEEARQASIAASEAEAKRLAEEEAAKSKMEITFYDMGQADAILLSCDGHYMLIDSGDLSVALSAKILEKNISQVDYVIASTPQNESVGGIARALNHINADKIFCTVNDYDSDKFTDFMAALEAQGKSITVPAAGDSYELGSATVTFLGPVTAPETLETSLIVKVTHQDNTFLFAGFADAEQLTAAANAGSNLSADVIKVGRHGREGCLSEVLMKTIGAKAAVISVGEGYGCPTESTLQILANAEVSLYRTDRQGNITVVSSVDGIAFSVETAENEDMFDGIVKQSPETEPTTEPVDEPTEPTEPADDPSEHPYGTGEEQPNASGWRYGRLLSDMQFHRLNCPKLAAVSDEEKEYFDNLRDEMYGWGFGPCEICHPMD